MSELRHSLESSLLPALQSAAPSTSGRNEPRHVNIDVAARDIVMPTLNGILVIAILRHTHRFQLS